MIIALSGKSGCGNTSVSTKLANRLDFRHVNFTFKQLARELGLTAEALHAMSKDDPQYDLELDRRQVTLARDGNSVLASRLAGWLVDAESFKIYLEVDLETRASRIAHREGKDFPIALEETRLRDKADQERFQKLYGINVDDTSVFDLIVDASTLTVEQLVDRLVGEIKLFRGSA